MIHQLAKGCAKMKTPIIPSGKNEQAVFDSAMEDCAIAYMKHSFWKTACAIRVIGTKFRQSRLTHVWLR